MELGNYPDSSLHKFVGECNGLVEAGIDVGRDEVRRGQRVDQVVGGQERRQEGIVHPEEAFAVLNLCKQFGVFSWNQYILLNIWQALKF